MTLRVSLYSIAAALLAAHFYRAGNLFMVALCLALPLLFFVRVRWSLYLLQWSAYAAAVVWAVATIEIVGLRRQLGQPWLLAAGILLAVALLTLLAGWLLNSTTIRNRYPD